MKALRYYQGEALDAIADRFLALDGGCSRQLVVLPTGTGKTVLFAHTLQHPDLKAWLEKFPADARKILVIAHRRELLHQAKAKILAFNPTLKVEIEQAENWASEEADVVVASIQTLAASQGKRFGRFDKKQLRVVIIDEAHHAVSPSYQSVLQDFGFLPPDSFMAKPENVKEFEQLAWQRRRLDHWDILDHGDQLLLGVTATSKRGDNVGLEAVFGEIVYSKSILDMIRAGFLSRLRAFRVRSQTDLSWVHTRGGDFDEQDLATAVDNAERNRVVVKAWLQHGKGRKTIAFCVNVKHAEELAAEFRAQGVKAQAISGQSSDRDQLLQAFEHGDLELLTNCQLLTEGIDIPSIGCIVHARPTKSELLYTQMTGRGTRIADGKRDCIIIDIVDLTGRHSLVTAPSLLGLPMDFDGQGEDLLDVVNKVDRLKGDNPLLDVSGAKSIDDLLVRVQEIDLFGPFEDEQMLNNSHLAWRKDGEGFVIDYVGPILNERVSVQCDVLGQWQATHNEGGKIRSLGKPGAMREAFKAAEEWMFANRSKEAHSRRRAAKWRAEPVTSSQIGFINKLNIPVNPDHLQNKGQASNLIDLYLARKRQRA